MSFKFKGKTTLLTDLSDEDLKLLYKIEANKLTVKIDEGDILNDLLKEANRRGIKL